MTTGRGRSDLSTHWPSLVQVLALDAHMVLPLVRGAAMTRGGEHDANPQFIAMFRRYQCRHCHSWVNYDEWVGRWFHQKRKEEELREWSWDGSSWVSTRRMGY